MNVMIYVYFDEKSIDTQGLIIFRKIRDNLGAIMMTCFMYRIDTM